MNKEQKEPKDSIRKKVVQIIQIWYILIQI